MRAFDTQALDYLVKPLNAARFGVAIARVRERMRVADAVTMAERLRALVGEPARAPAAPHGGNRISVITDQGQLLLDPDDIDWIEAEDYYAGVHAGGKHYRIRESLAALEARLDPAYFVRIHRSAIVRLAQVRELKLDAASDSEAFIVLRDGTKLRVSRRRLPQVRAQLRTRA